MFIEKLISLVLSYIRFVFLMYSLINCFDRISCVESRNAFGTVVNTVGFFFIFSEPNKASMIFNQSIIFLRSYKFDFRFCE